MFNDSIFKISVSETRVPRTFPAGFTAIALGLSKFHSLSNGGLFSTSFLSLSPCISLDRVTRRLELRNNDHDGCMQISGNKVRFVHRNRFDPAKRIWNGGNIIASCFSRKTRDSSATVILIINVIEYKANGLAYDRGKSLSASRTAVEIMNFSELKTSPSIFYFPTVPFLEGQGARVRNGGNYSRDTFKTHEFTSRHRRKLLCVENLAK
ncbi:unnamed protein product [Xylocopa violacea]|uniref:Uncharacterized protein n=1 Tax=Xylocopa violacea TaxID=135666 RepID=A0ABP1PFM2_XYLVO